MSVKSGISGHVRKFLKNPARRISEALTLSRAPPAHKTFNVMKKYRTPHGVQSATQ